MKCGSLKRVHHLSVESSVHGHRAGEPAIHIERPPPNTSFVLVVELLKFGNRTDEGTIVEALAPAWWEILRTLRNDFSQVNNMSPRKFEELIAGAYKAEGWRTCLTPASGDHGIDVIAEKEDTFRFRIHDQAKLYKPGNVVTAQEVRSLIATLSPIGGSKGASMGVVTTTSTFAPRIAQDPSIAGLLPHHLTLIDGPSLFARLDQIWANRS